MIPSPAKLRAAAASLTAAGLGGLSLWLFPSIELEFFANGAAHLAGLLTGTPVLRADGGWMIPLADLPVLVSVACSGVGYFVMVATLLAWHASQRGQRFPVAVGIGLLAGALLSITINALRVVAVIQAHRWIIPRFPESYGPLLHMVTGAAIFLPMLIGLNLLLELHGKRAVARSV